MSETDVDLFGSVARDLARSGFAVVDGFLPEDARRELAADGDALAAAGAFRPAAVGRGEERRVRAEERGDRIVWIDARRAGPAQRAYLARMEALRLVLNRELFLGLFGFELHHARYGPGARYRRHLDRFRGSERRILSTVCYLNVSWTGADGGALRMWMDDGTTLDVLPEGGRLVLFESARFHHEVRPATRLRQSLTGWFTAREETPGLRVHTSS